MSRFGRLELDNRLRATAAAPSAHAAPPGGADRDQRYWLGEAINERREGNHETALRYYSRAIELDRSLVAGWVGQVQMLIALGEYPEAELWARKSLELFKNNADLLAGRSQALCRTGDLKNAQAANDAAIAQPGESSYAWLARGELMLAHKQDLDRHCFDKAVQLDPDWLSALEIGEIHLYYGHATKAMRYFRSAVERAPQSAYCWYRQGVCETQLGLAAAARKSLEQCLQLVPGHADAARALAELRQGGAIARNFLRRLFPFK